MERAVQQFWETCDTAYAHNEITKHLKDYTTLTRNWETWFLSHLSFEGKTVLDYGIGGGYFGKYLFDTKKLARYIGVDIAERSLAKAKEVLAPYSSVKLVHTDTFYKTLKDPIDIFVCQAVIQHFFSLEYLIQFCKRVNDLNPTQILFQIAYSPVTKIHTSYKNAQDVARACMTNLEFLSPYFPSYKATFVSKIYPNDYQFILFTKDLPK